MVEKFYENQMNFQDIIENSSVITVSMRTCMPCKQLSPVMEKLSEEYPNIRFYKIEAEENRGLIRSLGITGVPTLFFYDNGELKYKMVGATSSSHLKRLIEEFF